VGVDEDSSCGTFHYVEWHMVSYLVVSWDIIWWGTAGIGRWCSGLCITRGRKEK